MAKTTGDTCTFCGRSSRDVNLSMGSLVVFAMIVPGRRMRS